MRPSLYSRFRMNRSAFRSSLIGLYSLGDVGVKRTNCSIAPAGYRNSTVGNGSAFSNPSCGKSSVNMTASTLTCQILVPRTHFLTLATPSPPTHSPPHRFLASNETGVAPPPLASLVTQHGAEHGSPKLLITRIRRSSTCTSAQFPSLAHCYFIITALRVRGR